MTGWSPGLTRTSPVISEYILMSGCTAVKLEVRAPEGPPSALERPMPNTRQPRKIRYTAAEWGRIMELARASSRPPARYVREASLGAAPRVRRSQANEDVIRELGRIGTALIRLAPTCKDLGLADFATTIDTTLTELLATVRRLD